MTSDADERLARIAALAAGLAHELRNVLAAADSSLFLATRLDHDEAARGEHVRAARAHVRTAQDLVSRSLAPAADGRLAVEPVSIRALVERSIAAALTAGARIEVDLPPPELTIDGDALLLERALVNLLENAAQAGARSGAASTIVRITARRVGAETLLEVADDGPGIDAALRSRLFQPLAKGHADGTGLGLRLVRAVAELHGGEASAEETPGGGATFALRFPDVPDVPDVPDPPDAAATP